MKKIFTLTTVLAAGFFAAKAQKVNGVIPYESSYAVFNGNFNKVDTTLLLPGSFVTPGCDTLFTYIVPSSGGYVTGYNIFLDLEKAQQFFGSGQVFAIFGSIQGKTAISGFENSNFSAKIYSVSGSNFNQLASASLSFSDIDTSSIDPDQAINVWLLSTPVAVSGSWAAAIEVGKYAADSTLQAGLVIYSSKDGCGNDLAWEKFHDGDWYPLSDETFSWGINIDILIGAFLIDYVTNPEAELISGVAVFPNPVENRFNLAYNTKVGGKVTIEVIDATGRVIRTINEGSKAAGTYVSIIEFDGMASGLYTYRLTVGANQTTGKFIVK